MLMSSHNFFYLGSLAVSRALGDYDYKNCQELGQLEQLVSPGISQS
jgi:hypothetical protein